MDMMIISPLSRAPSRRSIWHRRRQKNKNTTNEEEIAIVSSSPYRHTVAKHPSTRHFGFSYTNSISNALCDDSLFIRLPNLRSLRFDAIRHSNNLSIHMYYNTKIAKLLWIIRASTRQFELIFYSSICRHGIHKKGDNGSVEKHPCTAAHTLARPVYTHTTW